MSVLRINKKPRILKRCLALCVAIALLLAVPARVNAAEEVSVEEMKSALNALKDVLSNAAASMSTGTEPVPTETAAPTGTEPASTEAASASTETEGSSETAVPTQLDYLNKSQTLVDYILNLNWKKPYLRKDLLDYVVTFTSCVQQSSQLQESAHRTQNSITACADLEQETREDLVSAVQTFNDSLNNCPFDELATNLTAAEQPASYLGNEKLTAYSNSLVQSDEALKQYDALLDLLPDWLETKKRVDEIEGSINGASRDRLAPAGNEFASVKLLQALCEEKNAIVGALKIYSEMSAGEQNALRARIEALPTQMERTLTECLAESVREGRTQSLIQNDLKNQLGNVEGKLLLVYIALAVAAVGLILGIAVLIISLDKARVSALKAQELEQMFVAKADNLNTNQDKLSKQLEEVYTRQDKLDKRIEQLSVDMAAPSAAEQELAELKRIMLHMQTELSKPTVLPVQKKILKKEKVDPVPVPVGRLHLNYNAVAPTMSLLESREDGAYVCYSDMTIAPAVLHQINTGGSWQNTGILYLFDLVLNGSVVTPAQMGGSFYEITEVIERAAVSENNQIIKKGKLRIQKRA